MKRIVLLSYLFLFNTHTQAHSLVNLFGRKSALAATVIIAGYTTHVNQKRIIQKKEPLSLTDLYKVLNTAPIRSFAFNFARRLHDSAEEN